MDFRLRRADGTVQRWYGTYTEIDDIKTAELRTADAHRKLAAALAAMSDAVFNSDATGGPTGMNEAFARFHRFRSKEECPRDLAEYAALLEVRAADGTLLPPEQWFVPRALRGESGTGVEVTLHRRDTGETWVGSYTYAPFRDARGEIAGSVVTARDVTGPRHAA